MMSLASTVPLLGAAISPDRRPLFQAQSVSSYARPMQAYRMVAWKTAPEYQEVPQPEPGPGQVLVRVGAAASATPTCT